MGVARGEIDDSGKLLPVRQVIARVIVPLPAAQTRYAAYSTPAALRPDALPANHILLVVS
jgi:hypothetical protein